MKPRSARDGPAGRHGEAVAVAVRAPALEGRANEAACRVLAEMLDVSPGAVSLVGGARARAKRFLVEGLSVEDAAVRLGRQAPRR